MAKKSSKNKSSKSKAKRKTRRRISWWKIFISLIILLAGIVYFLLQYDGLNMVKDKFDEYLPKRDMEVNLYFADSSSDYLVAERRTIPKDFAHKQRITQTIKELIKGPRGRLIQTIPSKTTLKDVRIDKKGVVWLDFNAHLSKDHPGGSSAEISTVYSIVNTVLLNFKDVKKVRILIDGHEIKTLAGHIDCSQPLMVDRGLIK